MKMIKSIVITALLSFPFIGFSSDCEWASEWCNESQGTYESWCVNIGGNTNESCSPCGSYYASSAQCPGMGG